MIVERRCEELNITEIHQGSKDKLATLNEILSRYGADLGSVAYMGDDEPDICILEKVGLACCPNDAVKEVKKICNFISSYNGGKGAVRELCDFILEQQGIEKEYIVCEGAQKNA